MKRSERAATELTQRLLRSERRLQVARELVKRTEYPTFELMLTHYRAHIRRATALGATKTEPVLEIPRKLRNISLAQSHGMSVPQIYQVWDSLDEIQLTGMPDMFVLKADGGAGGHAVFPLRREGDRFWRVGSSARSYTEDDIRRAIQGLGTRARAPFFAEEYLPPNDADHPVPDDVKVYVFYGVPAQVLLMRVADTAKRTGAVRKYLDPRNGGDLGEIYPGAKFDPEIPTPTHLAEIVKAAEHLSRASGVAFCRVDFFDTRDGPVFGEITSAPGGRQRYVDDHDAWMASEWLDARIRLKMDRAGGRPDGALWGPHAYEWHYSDRPDPRHPDSAASHVASCDEWCLT